VRRSGPGRKEQARPHDHVQGCILARMLIWGLRAKAKVLARLMLICRACGNPAAQTLVERVRWFTLFFIPLIPFSRKRLMQCAFCGTVTELTSEEAAGLVASAQQAPTGTPQDAAAVDLRKTS